MDKDEFRLNDDTMRDLRRIAQSPGELEWRMELLTKLERINLRHELFTRATMTEFKRLHKEKTNLTQVTRAINIELDERLKPAKSVAKQIGKGAIWILERCALIAFAYMGVKLGINH